MKRSVKKLVLVMALIFLSGCSRKADENVNIKADTAPIKEEPLFDANSDSDSVSDSDDEAAGDLNDISWEAEQYSGTDEIAMSIREQQEWEQKALKAAACYQRIYQSAKKSDDLNQTISEHDINKMVSALSEAGYCAVAKSCNMAHPEYVTEFCDKANRQENASLEVYQVNDSGGLLAFFFCCTGNKITVTGASVSWNQKGSPVLTDMHKYGVDDYRLTENGYFFYRLSISDTMAISEENAFRIIAIDEECQRLNEAYIKPVGYQGNNLFLTDWDERNMDSLSLNDLFEYLYPLSSDDFNQEMPEKSYVDPALFEQTMVACLPLTVKQVRERAVYEKNKGYQWERFYTPQLAPVPEVRSYERNEDGSITLLVHAVCLDYGTDLAFAHKVTLLETADGVRFLANEIIPSEVHIMPEYTPRISK